MSQFAIRLSMLTVCATALVVISAGTPARRPESICMSRSTSGTASSSARPGRLVRRRRLPDTTLRPSRFARPSARASTARYGRRRLPTIPIGKRPGTEGQMPKARIGRPRPIGCMAMGASFNLAPAKLHWFCPAKYSQAPSLHGASAFALWTHPSGNVKTRPKSEERPMPIIDFQVHAYEANTPQRPWHSVPNWPASRHR